MKILVIGLGSMGKRRIRLILNNFPEYKVIGIDTQSERRSECEEKFKISTYDSISEAVEENRPNSVFICTSPLSHNSIIKECLAYGLNVFTEINLVSDGYEDNIELAKSKNLTLFLSSTFLYRNEIIYIKNRVSDYSGKLLYTYHVGQYLPDWHPWESYKNFFLSDVRTNGCREILSIDMPWIIKTFGKIKDVKAVRTKITELDIDYPDSYIITMVHENGNIGTFITDVVSRKAIRELRISGENINLTWEGTVDSLKQFNINSGRVEPIEVYENIDKLEGYTASIIENAYLEEIKEFFDVVNGKIHARYSFSDDLYTLKLIDHIEEACQ